ncbi:Translation initiation factor SUI1-related protein [hydrothermal vent metagenome]|uniref:Translation initiation factor SUI1-related protein n=1 Tax=hydrothermal vent metagenome TaxID=652676 RepID=A0A1W1EEE5_9ZZZZ
MANKKDNLFEIGAKFSDGWSSDNKNRDETLNVQNIILPEKHLLHFSKEKRRGKVVTIVKPFFLEKKELQSLLKILKKRLGTGGTVKDNTLEFQGELQVQLKTILESLNYRFKK